MRGQFWRQSLEKPVFRRLGLPVALAALFVVGHNSLACGQDREVARPANAEKALPAPPARQPRPALQLAQQRVIIGGGFRVQVGPAGRTNNEDGSVNYAIFPGNRELVRQLERAQESIREGHLADAFQLLDDILGEAQDFFYQPDRNEQLHRSLKTEARRLIGSLPAEALTQYDLQFGATARHLLDQALAQGLSERVAAVARRYFHTPAGFEAAWMLGRQHLDHGRTLAAALTFQMLYDAPRARERFEPALSLTLATCWLRAGVDERAASVLRESRKQSGRPRIAAKDVPWFAGDASAVEWLIANTAAPPEFAAAAIGQWTLHRGNPARNAASGGGSPLLSTPRWQQTLTTEAVAVATTETMTRRLVESEQVDIAPETPLAVGDTAVVRTPRWIVGIDLETGKRIWEYPTWENENSSRQQQVMDPMTGSRLTVNPEKLATRTTIASDGRAVFIVEDRGNQPYVFSGMFNAFGRPARGSSPTSPGSYNKLLARELSTEGKLLWEVGGETGEAEPQLAGVYFLGAPLALGGQLYVIGELKGEITLFVLESESGALDWSQPLATVESTVAIDAFRRLHGASPSFADGVIVCPTSAGAVVAVDLANRSLMWGYQYPRNQTILSYRGRRANPVANPLDDSGWSDGSVILSGGRVLVSPADSDSLHCINLVDGKETWQAPRGENLYVGAVHRDTVLVVGPKQIQGLKLTDGQAAWPAQAIAGDSGGVTSGRGFLSAGYYYLPLSSAEVLKIDVAGGAIQARVKSRKGYVPGNLVSYEGHVLSLTEDSLDCFFQLDERGQWATETLSVRPDDPEALALLGEILIDQGKFAEGLVQLERAFSLAPSDRLRQLILEAHLELLRQDFAGHRDRAGEIEQLLNEPEQKAQLAREMALGLHKLGENMAAFQQYVKMCQPGEDSQKLETVTPNQHSVRRDRWVRGKLAELRAAASPAEHAQMDELIAAHFLAREGTSNLATQRQFRDYFGDGPPLSNQSELIERLIAEQEFLEAEWWLMRAARSGERGESAAAYWRLARLMESLHRPDDAASCYRQLMRRFADQAVDGDRTGLQAVEALPDDSPVRHYLASSTNWPAKVVKREPSVSTLQFPGVQLEIGAGREPFFEHLTLEMDARRRQLLIRDGYGRQRFAAVALTEQRRRTPPVNHSSVPWARANGHLLLIQERTQILAIDTLTAAGDGKERVLWRHDLADLAGDGSDIVVRPNQGPNRRVRSQWFDQSSRPIGGIWPVGSELVCLQRGNTLLGIDALTGAVLWTRFDIAPANEIFGDEEFLFVVPHNTSQATVLRTLDGAKLGNRTVPVNDRFTTHGRKVVQFSNRGGDSTVRVVDPWASEKEGEIWKQDFARNAKIESIDADEIAVMDPKGRFVVYSLEDEKPIIDTQIKAESGLADLQVFRTPERYVLLAGRQLQFREGMPHRYAVQNNSSRSLPVIEGRAYGFDRPTGKLLWATDLPVTAALLNQPAHVPLLVFAMNVNEQSKATSQRATTSVLCLDTRDGGIVYEASLGSPSTTVVPIADPAEHTLQIQRNTSSIILHFGDQAAPDDASEKESAEGGPKAEEKADAAVGDASKEERATEPQRSNDNPIDNPFGPPK